MKKNGCRKVLAALLALLLAIPGSWAAFAETIIEPKVYGNGETETLDADISVVGHREALVVNSYKDLDVDVTVNGNVSLETTESDSSTLAVCAEADSTADITVNGNVEATGTNSSEYGQISAIYISGKGENAIYIYGDLVISAKEMLAMGINTLDGGWFYLLSRGGDGEESEQGAAGATDSVTVSGDMIVTSENNVAVGINNNDDGSAPKDIQVDIGGDLTVSGTSGTGIHALNPNPDGETPEKEFHIGGDLNVTGTQNFAIGVELAGNQTTTVNIDGDVTVNGDDEGVGVLTSGGNNTVNIGGDVTANGDDAGVGVAAGGNGDITLDIGGSVDVSGGTALGVFANTETGTLTVDIGGAVSATMEGDDESGRAAGLELNVMGGSVTATVGEGVTAESGSAGTMGIGIYAFDSTVNVTVENGGVTSSGAEDYFNAGVEIWNAGSQVQADVTGDVESDNGTGILICGENPDQENPATTSVHVDGNVTGTGADSCGIYADVSDGEVETEEGTELVENNHQVEILVEGDVTAENTAVWIDADTTVGTVDLTVDGTVSGEEHSIVLGGEANQDQISITVWEVKPNDAGALVERADVDSDTGDTVYTRDEEAEKQIQYIIRIDQPEFISAEGTAEHNGYQVAHEGDTVYVKLNIPDGFILESVWRDAGQSLEVIRDAQGRYYLAVPRGGGVELSVTLREIATERPLSITMDPNGGTIDGKEGVLVLAAYDGRIFTLPAAPEKEGSEFLGWYATPYAKEDARWIEPAADSAELKQPGQKDRITRNTFYTAIWGEPAAEEAGEASAPEAAEAGAADVTEAEAEEPAEPAGSEAAEPEAEAEDSAVG